MSFNSSGECTPASRICRIPKAFSTVRVEAVMKARNGAASVMKKSIGPAMARATRSVRCNAIDLGTTSPRMTTM